VELGNFGAILRFALQLEEQSMAFYQGAAQPRQEETFRSLGEISRKRLRLLERARREGIVEMVLEPITGFDSVSYHLRLDTEADEAEFERQALALEDTAARFYRDAADKLPIRGVARLFRRLARENEQRRADLETQLGC
jgi:rubrerythrin